MWGASGWPRARGEPSAAEVGKLLAEPERVLVEEGVAEVHRRPLVEVAVEHGRCRRGEGVRQTPTFLPTPGPRKGQDPTTDPTTVSPYPAAGKQKGSGGSRSTRSGWSLASAGSVADGQTDRQTGARNNPGVSLGAAPVASGSLGAKEQHCRHPGPKVKQLTGDLASEPGPILASDSRSQQIPGNPLPGWRGQRRSGTLARGSAPPRPAQSASPCPTAAGWGWTLA